MNKDLIMLLKSIYANANERKHYIHTLNEIIAEFNQNKLQVEEMMAVEERLLTEKVSQVNHLRPFFSIAVSDVDLF